VFELDENAYVQSILLLFRRIDMVIFIAFIVLWFLVWWFAIFKEFIHRISKELTRIILNGLFFEVNDLEYFIF